MPLVDIEISINGSVLPDDVVAFLHEADLRVSQFVSPPRAYLNSPNSPIDTFLANKPQQQRSCTRMTYTKETCMDDNAIFAYPWPGEEWVIARLFEKYAAEGALLLTYDHMNSVVFDGKVQLN